VGDAYEARFTGEERWLRIVRVSDGQPVHTRGTEAFDDALAELNRLAAENARLREFVRGVAEEDFNLAGRSRDRIQRDARAALREPVGP
jgi:hypothetical protein